MAMPLPPITVQILGGYNPIDRALGTPAPAVRPTPSPRSGKGGFLHDVWTGATASVGGDLGAVLHPLRTARGAIAGVTHPGQGLANLARPYADDLRTGHPGEALGRVLGHVALIGGAILGGRALFGMGAGGGASVGMGSPLGEFFAKVGGALGTLAHGAWSVVSAPFRWIGGLLGGGGAHVGF